MRRYLPVVCLVVGLVACTDDQHAAPPVDASPDGPFPAPRCSGTYTPSDASTVCAVRCTSTNPNSDVAVALDQTAAGSALFTVRVIQHVPTATDDTFDDATASWSGDFFNFAGSNSSSQFHLLAADGQVANVEVYSDANTMSGGPVNVSSLDCTIVGN
jgi:hypothetical protein